MEATGHAHWFERLLAELNFELWIGDPADFSKGGHALAVATRVEICQEERLAGPSGNSNSNLHIVTFVPDHR
jgi:hypothetical protein